MREIGCLYYECYRGEETLGGELLRWAKVLPVFLCVCVCVCAVIQGCLGSFYSGYHPGCVRILATPYEVHLFDGRQPKQTCAYTHNLPVLSASCCL